MIKDWWQATFPQGRQTITINDANGYPIRIAYGEKGSGKPIILAHGIGSWSYGWRYLIEPLAKQFRVICFDAKGHGFSDKPLSSEQPGHQVAELKQVIQALCDQPAAVVAQSLGALVTLAAAQANPELFARLVLINVPIFPEQLPSWKMRLLADLPLNLIQTFDRVRLARLLAPLVRKVVGVARREVVVSSVNITPEDVYWITYPYITFAGAIAKYAEELRQAAVEIKRLEHNQPNLISSVQDHLSAIACPTLILWGSQDQWFPASHGEKLHAHLLNSRFQILSDCGHDAAGCSPEGISSAVLAFLRDTDYQAAANLSPDPTA